MDFNKGGLIGYNIKANKTFDFDSTDSERNFKHRCKTIKDWTWKHTPIEYKYNSFGHRCKELVDIDHENFLLTFGCSYTVGIGINETDTWAYKLSQTIGSDLYNIALEASGCDIQAYNTMHWVTSKFPKPKLVVVQWPYHERKTFVHKNNEDNTYFGLDKVDTNDADGSWYRKRYIMDDGEMVYANRIWFEYLNTAWQNLGVPVLNFTWENGHEEIMLDNYKLWPVRCKNGSMQARDMQHDGPEWHDETVEKLLGLLASYKI